LHGQRPVSWLAARRPSPPSQDPRAPVDDMESGSPLTVAWAAAALARLNGEPHRVPVGPARAGPPMTGSVIVRLSAVAQHRLASAARATSSQGRAERGRRVVFARREGPASSIFPAQIGAGPPQRRRASGKLGTSPSIRSYASSPAVADRRAGLLRLRRQSETGVGPFRVAMVFASTPPQSAFSGSFGDAVSRRTASVAVALP
jgi:hypothetical protein